MTSATETDCPSHIEARERLAGRVEARLEKARADLKHAEENRDGWFSTMPADLWQDMEDEIKLFEDLRTLLATPTQGEDISSSRDHDPAIGFALEPVEAVAEAWASMDGKLESFRECKRNKATERKQGRYGGYMADARSLIERTAARGFVLSSAEQVAGKAPGMQNNTSDTPTQEPRDQFPHQAHLRACGPTQEAVGREEIARIIDPRTFERWDVLCDQAGEIEADRQYGAACARAFVKADAILSLLLAPKPGEGLEAAVARVWAEESGDRSSAIGCVQAKPQQPAPGAPEDVQRETFRLKTNPESDPVLKAIIDVRHRAAGDFTPSHSGQRGEDFDRGLLAAFHAAQDAILAALKDNGHG